MNISNDQVVEAYGDHHDGIYIYKNNRKVGFITDLKIKLDKEKRTKTKVKANSARLTKESHENALILCDDLTTHLAPYDAEVFMNICQPNIKVAGSTLYIIAGAFGKPHRMSVMHPNLEFDDLAIYFSDYSMTGGATSKNSIMLNNLEIDDIVSIVKKLIKDAN